MHVLKSRMLRTDLSIWSHNVTFGSRDPLQGPKTGHKEGLNLSLCCSEGERFSDRENDMRLHPFRPGTSHSATALGDQSWDSLDEGDN